MATANQERGELNFVVEGKTYVLAMGINALCSMETKGPQNPSGRPFEVVLAGIRAGSLVDGRLLLWAALQPHHAEEIKTVEDAGVLLDKAGSTRGLVRRCIAIINELMALNAPEEDDSAKGENATSEEPRPLVADPGTGAPST